MLHAVSSYKNCYFICTVPHNNINETNVSGPNLGQEDGYTDRFIRSFQVSVGIVR
jgi:hypothetical protein